MVQQSDSLVSLAARLGDRRLEWNELDFVGWKEFRRMAPTVIGLETARIDRMIAGSEVGGDFYNALVRVRYALRRFVDAVQNAGGRSPAESEELLENALMGLSLAVKIAGERDSEALRYIAHRLTYVHKRIKLIY